MAERPTTELTEVKRTPLNQAQGKKIQIVEYEWVPATSDADGDHIVLSDIDGIDSVLAVLSVQSWASGASVEVLGTDWKHLFTRRAATGTTYTPPAGEDRLYFVTNATDSWAGCLITVMIEST